MQGLHCKGFMKRLMEHFIHVHISRSSGSITTIDAGGRLRLHSGSTTIVGLCRGGVVVLCAKLLLLSLR